MRSFAEILGQFTMAQRMVVLVLLLAFTSGTYLVGQWMETDDCRAIVEENIRMHEDFAKISSMARENRMRAAVDSAAVAGVKGIVPQGRNRGPASDEPQEGPGVMDQILKISETHAR